MRGRVRLCPYYFVEPDRVTLRGALATICPPDKKLLHGMRDAILSRVALRRMPNDGGTGSSRPRFLGWTECVPPLQPQTARNQDAIEQIEQSLHREREERGWNGAFKNGDVVVEVEPA